ncbi:hypothetical protein QYF61_021328 [Mycteria americana]|uniref:Uncharacterized protein n=1 Tax=Mycteria americana TaxID=33587 RepID=A0AAN7RJG1_MYCAM|nr:hypothetical protein QYF61_021328 [Mycteria americana]
MMSSGLAMTSATFLSTHECIPSVTAFVHEGRTVDVVHLSLSKACGMVSCNVLVPRLGHYSLDGSTNSWVKHQLDDEAERAVFHMCVHDPEEETLTTFVNDTTLEGPFLCLRDVIQEKPDRQEDCPVRNFMN